MLNQQHGSEPHNRFQTLGHMKDWLCMCVTATDARTVAVAVFS